MSDARETMQRQWMDAWLRARRELERIRREELRAFRHSENVHIIDALLQLGHDFAQPRSTSGLVEQQRIFQKARQ